MKTAANSFDALAACLRGQPPSGVDWIDVRWEANQHLVTPALHIALKNCSDSEIPADVREYTSFIYHKNHERNLGLRSQAIEAIEALSKRGIETVPLKGAGILLAAADEQLGLRIMTDLDLMVPEDQVPAAMDCLLKLDYKVLSRQCGSHADAVLGRAGNFGPIDLHHRPPGPTSLHSLSALSAESTMLSVGNAQARLPSPTLRAFHLIVHDLLHDNQFRSGDINLRHLLDLEQLARAPGSVDWIRLALMMTGRREHLALRTQLVMLHRLLGVDIPIKLLIHPASWFQHWRRMLRVRRPEFAKTRSYGMITKLALAIYMVVYWRAGKSSYDLLPKDL
jgi:hypothetical protein